MSADKIFLLGVGCQKGGTTWLHKYLHGLPECNLGFAKEYHTFDSRYLDVCRGLHTAKLKRLTGLLRRKERFRFLPRPALDRTIATLARLIVFNNDFELYADYFDRLWNSDERIMVVGDITPAYSGLKSVHFAEIRRLLESRGFAVRVVFLMRDPVERCYSAARSLVQKLSRKAAIPDPLLTLKDQYATPSYQIRTRYEDTIQNLEEVFAKDEIFYGFYESLFNSDEIRRLNGFLGLNSQRLPDFSQSENSSPPGGDVPRALAQEIRDYYRKTYEFCTARFGRDMIDRIWPHP